MLVLNLIGTRNHLKVVYSELLFEAYSEANIFRRYEQRAIYQLRGSSGSVDSVRLYLQYILCLDYRSDSQLTCL